MTEHLSKILDLNIEKVYYVYSPSWVDWSAGIKALHLLVHHLNLSQNNAFLVLHDSKSGGKNDTNPKLLTPVLSPEILKQHRDLNFLVVAIYPESISGNPLNAPVVIRWLLNYPKLLGGVEEFPGELVISYSEAISENYCKQFGIYPSVLFIPAVDLEEISLFRKGANLNGKELVYAEKYLSLGGKIALTSDQILLTRFKKNSPKRTKLLELISQTPLLHAYENTTCITEAVLMGKPVLCHRNEFFQELIASKELSNSGISWEKDQINYPDDELVWGKILEAQINIASQIKSIFPLYTVDAIPNSRVEVKLPKRALFSAHAFSRFNAIMSSKGPRVAIRYIRNYIWRRWKS